MQSFLDLSGYFRKLVPRYSEIARPLTDLLIKDSTFVYGESELEVFGQLKRILCSQAVLHLYTVGAETELHIDASVYGFGAILYSATAKAARCIRPTIRAARQH